MPMLIPLLYFVTTGLTLVLEKIPQKVNRMLYGGIYMFFILISAASFYYVHAADIVSKKDWIIPGFLI